MFKSLIFWRIFAFEFKYTLKRPLIWAGMIIITLYLLYEYNFYYTTYPLLTEAQYREQHEKYDRNENNYLTQLGTPLSDDERYVSLVINYCKFLETNYDINMSKTAAYIIKEQLDYDEINEYIKLILTPSEKPIVLLDAFHISLFEQKMRGGIYSEYIEHIKNQLSQELYTEFIGRSVADIGGVLFMFYCFAVFPMAFDSDRKNSIYEILHSKKIRKSIYVVSKTLGFGAVVILMGFIMTTVLNIAVSYHCYKNNIDFSVLSFYKYYFLWLVPSTLFTGSVIVAFTIVFKSGIPAIPFLVFYMILGTMPTTNDNGYEIITQYFWNILVRIGNNTGYKLEILPHDFYQAVVINKVFQIIITILFMAIAIYFYNKKKFKSSN